MYIKLIAKECNQLDAAAEVLEKYSRLYKELYKNIDGMHFDDAGTAAGMIRKLLEANKE